MSAPKTSRMRRSPDNPVRSAHKQQHHTVSHSLLLFFIFWPSSLFSVSLILNWLNVRGFCVSCLYFVYPVYILCILFIFCVSCLYFVYPVYVLSILFIFCLSCLYFVYPVYILCILFIFCVSCLYFVYPVYILSILFIFCLSCLYFGYPVYIRGILNFHFVS
jgi:hypothetical protein